MPSPSDASQLPTHARTASTSATATTTVSAPGKVLVAGGYLVLDRPNVGVVLAATARFFTSIKWTQDQAPVPVAAPAEGGGSLLQPLRIKVESPQFRSIHWYECVFYEDGRLPILLSSPDQAPNIFVERALTYVLGYLLWTEGARGGESDTIKDNLRRAREEGRTLAIKLRADNDFYSQTSQLRARGLPCTSSALATLPPFLACPLSEDGKVVVAKTGMGSSAALVSSLVGALLSFFGAAFLPCCDDTPGQESGPGVSKSLDLTHNLAQACHCVAQGKVGSGFDVSAAVYGTHTYTRFSKGELSDALSAGDAPPTPTAPGGDKGETQSDGCETPSALERISKCVSARGGWDAERGELRLPPCFRLLMGDVCGGSSTPSMVRKVLAWRGDPSTADRANEVWSGLASTNTTIADLLNALARAAASSSAGDDAGDNTFEASMQALSSLPWTRWTEASEGEAVGASSLDQLLQLQTGFATARRLLRQMGECKAFGTSSLNQLLRLQADFGTVRRLLREMGEEAGVPIEPPVQTELVDATSALPGVLCAGVPGAGGVDAVFAIVVHPNAEDGVRSLWADWLVGGGGENGGAVVCPLSLTASEGGIQGGIVCTRSLPWE